jgi:hypothetical protein
MRRRPPVPDLCFISVNTAQAPIYEVACRNALC